jgi:protein TonB
MKADVSVERTELIEPDEKPVTLGASATAFLKQTGKEEQKRQGETIVEESNIFITTDQPPRFPGGDDSLALYISNNLHYPLTEQKGDTERKVHVSFVVEKDGSITHVEIRRGAGADFDQEAIRLVSSMPPWSPALQNNRPVRALYQMVIHFPQKE